MPAITTYGKNNHALRSEKYRYIKYEDGSEEFYAHDNDANEWYNLATSEETKMPRENLQKYLPKINRHEAKGSTNNANEYFRMTSTN